eukprot:m.432747 g.432747  ORF g.432747 m.432747 type:complete len:63 (+) comp17483_c0_seq1:5905-6093(+)
MWYRWAGSGVVVLTALDREAGVGRSGFSYISVVLVDMLPFDRDGGVSTGGFFVRRFIDALSC